jgi:uncharacterized protein
MTGPLSRLLPDGRLHLQHGPIDMIVQAEGPGAAEGLARAVARFAGLLQELVDALPLLRRPVGPGAAPSDVRRTVVGRMYGVASGFRPAFVTPMAAVAGAGAEAILDAVRGPGITRASVNNGGDIALHLVPGAAPWRVGIVVDPAAPQRLGHLTVGADSPVRGIATSGARGRSHSLGIADSVTVLAADAPTADVAATLIGNAVDLPGHPAITRMPATALSPDSDLGDRLVTTHVGPLTGPEIACALDAGEAFAARMIARGKIHSAALVLGGTCRIVGPLPLSLPERTLAHV